MKKVEVWKTTDGKLFEAKDDAGSHQYELDCRQRLAKIIACFHFPGMTAIELEDNLWEHRFNLMEALHVTREEES